MAPARQIFQNPKKLFRLRNCRDRLAFVVMADLRHRRQIRGVCVRRRHYLSSCGASDGTLFRRRNVAIERTQHPRTERRFVSICRSIAASSRSDESRSAGPAEDGDPLFLHLPRVNSTENMELAPRDLVSGSLHPKLTEIYTKIIEFSNRLIIKSHKL